VGMGDEAVAASLGNGAFISESSWLLSV
jgi:hypothetical protein